MNEAPFAVLCAWLLFGGAHVVLGFPPLRPRLARRLGEQRFVALFSAVATLTLGLLAATVAVFGGSGPAGFDLAAVPVARVVLSLLGASGLLLAMAALPIYHRSPMALFRDHFPLPHGMARVSRHGFFVGLTVFALTHALLVPTLAQCLYFAGFAMLAGIGATWQDRKLLARHGQAYADYMAATSVLPIVALLRGRQRFVPEDRIGMALLRAGGATALLLLAHPLWTAWHGAAFASLMAIGGVFLTAKRIRAGRAEVRSAGAEAAR